MDVLKGEKTNLEQIWTFEHDKDLKITQELEERTHAVRGLTQTLKLGVLQRNHDHGEEHKTICRKERTTTKPPCCKKKK